MNPTVLKALAHAFDRQFQAPEPKHKLIPPVLAGEPLPALVITGPINRVMELDGKRHSHVREFPIEKQGVVFDSHEFDQREDAYIEAMAIEKQTDQNNNSPRSGRQGAKQWREKQCWGSTKGTGFGI
ncbi:hypothetical protein A7J50_3748 [Pseudomonas antarctica]|uniref:Uncharacterized protein n=1 Tax=Pseudomonas antarctica TaxID=219572 RepID=A0A172Z417_9PSED|nr:hypothetical protein [Pseudomonas antarctica]ANF87121.1 hypothetical protein A7J50_3748 [Pseudomonas antarctica]